MWHCPDAACGTPSEVCMPASRLLCIRCASTTACHAAPPGLGPRPTHRPHPPRSNPHTTPQPPHLRLGPGRSHQPSGSSHPPTSPPAAAPRPPGRTAAAGPGSTGDAGRGCHCGKRCRHTCGGHERGHSADVCRITQLRAHGSTAAMEAAGKQGEPGGGAGRGQGGAGRGRRGRRHRATGEQQQQGEAAAYRPPVL